jgi:4-alpha-glucanotransferase/predicted trehalose synthase
MTPIRNGQSSTKQVFSSAFLGMRSMGVAAPLSYFRSRTDWGVGDLDTLGQVIDWARATNQRIVQLLPLYLSVSSNSPYSIASIYVLDPVYIGMRTLLGQLDLSESERERAFQDALHLQLASEPKAAVLRSRSEATFEQTRALKRRVLHAFAQSFFREDLQARGKPAAKALIGNDSFNGISITDTGNRFLSYCEQNRHWLSDHILYFLLRQKFSTDDFRQWPSELAVRDPDTLRSWKSDCQEQILEEAFLQWILNEQLHLRNREAGGRSPQVELMLDKPFAFGQADVWIHREAFLFSSSTLKREFTQGVPPHRLDIPQHWQFTLLQKNQAAKDLMLDRLHYLLPFCSLLRIDHLLGYYRLFQMSEDIEWVMTLANLGAWDEIQAVYRSASSAPEKRAHIFRTILGSLQRALPADIIASLFLPDGSLRKASTILAARRDMPPGEIDRDTTGWYRQSSVEHGQDLLYLLLNPNPLGDIDYLAVAMENPDTFLRPTDSIRVCFFQPGFGEEIITAFLAAAQAAGKTLVAENLGEVPPEVEQSLRELGLSQFKPLYFGYQKFIGDPNDYWVDRITSADCACFGYHDTVTVRGWWTGQGKWSERKYYFRNNEQKQAVLDWLQERGYLSSSDEASLSELTVAMHDAVLASVADSEARMVVFQMPDLFGSGDEGIINVPGQLGFWTTRAPLLIEELLQAAMGLKDGEVDPLANATVSRMRRLAAFRSRDSLFIPDRLPSGDTPRFLAIHPNPAPGSKQIAFADESFCVDAIVGGACHRADLVLDDGRRISMDRIPADDLPTGSISVFRCALPVMADWFGTHGFRICLENRVWSDRGYLIDLPCGTDANPVSATHGRIRGTIASAIWPVDDPLRFLQELAEALTPWIQTQHWYLGKGSPVIRTEAVDGFRWEGADRAGETIGIFLRVEAQTGQAVESQIYYLPLQLFSSLSQAAGATLFAPAAIIGNRYLFFAPAENTVSYQRFMLRHLAEKADLKTMRGNRLAFQPVPAQPDILDGEILSARDLLAGTGDTSSNLLTEVQMGGKTLVVKTFKRGADDIEAEMYATLWRQQYTHVLSGFGEATLVQADGKRIPVALTMKKLNGPHGISRQESMAGFQAYKAFAAGLRGWIDDGAPSAETRCLAEAMAQPTDACCDLGAMLRELGEVLATLHIALAKSDEPGFGVRAATPADLHLLFHDGMQRGLQIVSEKIKTLQGAEYDLIRHRLPALRRTLVAHAGRWVGGLPTVNLSRIHGDMQLEQIMLNAEYQWIILDLGGAPLLPMAARRAMTCASQDVAGILRAFGYIKYAALEAELRMERKTVLLTAYAAHPQTRITDSVRVTLDFADALEKRFTEQFVASYLDTIERERATRLFLPEWDRNIAAGLIEHSCLLRAIYEMQYETSVRPEEGRILMPFETLSRWLAARRKAQPAREI